MTAPAPHRVAVIADAHFHDPEGDFGIGIRLGDRRLALRGWAEVQGAPRAVNESAQALRAALDRIVAAGLRHVVLAGDYTDDGQAETTRRLAALLHGYAARHGLRFYAIPGNHDVYGPHGKHVTVRLATAPGQSVLVTSDEDLPDAHVTPAMRCEGQPAALHPMAAFGLFRDPRDLHWESPFGPSDAAQARMYLARAADRSVEQTLMDASYLVEPEPGLWLLMIDANVYEPRPGRRDATRKKAFHDASDAGWNAVLRVKPFLLPWIADVAARAERLGKTLVPVSHYPVLDPFEDAAGSEAALFGQTPTVRRTPGPAVGQTLIRAGLRWHLGGHLHVLGTGRMKTADGTLTNFAVPSLAAFPPAFTVVSATPSHLRAEAHDLCDLPPDPRLSAFYASEGREGLPLPYGAFLAGQFRARLLQRWLPAHWPEAALAVLQDGNAAGLAARLGHERLADAPAWSDYSGMDLACDAALIRVAGRLAFGIVSPERLAICRSLACLGDDRADPTASPEAFLRRWLSVLQVSLIRADRQP